MRKPVVLITGASQGIGSSLVEAYRAAGFRVVANSRSIRPSEDPGVLAVAAENARRVAVAERYALLPGSAFTVGHGYILGLPVAAYLTWQGRMLENSGIAPKFCVALSRDALREGRDTQLETAVEAVKAM